MNAHDGARTQLIPIQTNNDNPAVLGRDLHTFLEVSTAYKDWFPRMVAYGFEQDRDFSSFLSESTGGRPRQDHILTLDMAKEISMIQRTDKGKQARQYFIECERRAKEATPALPQDYASALRELAATVEAREIAEKRAAEQESIARQHAKRLELTAPKVAKADAHSEISEWKRRQDFYREVQQWGAMHGMKILHANVRNLLTRKKMLIAGNRADAGQITSQAIKNGWGRNHKGVADNGHAFCTPQLSPRGQDLAWKWITQAVEEYGAELNPNKEVA